MLPRYIYVGLKHTEIMDDSNDSNIIQVPSIQFSEEPAAIESSRTPDKILLVPPPSVPKRKPARQPALSITTHLFGSTATPIEYSISPYPIYCTGRCREEPECDVELKADVVRAKTRRPALPLNLSPIIL